MNRTNLIDYTVSELAFALKRTVEDAYGQVRVRGELSGFKRAGSGHLYFCLKDDRAVLDAVAWRNTLPRLSFEPADGLEVICTGRLTTYPGRSRYQLSVDHIEPAGVGALMALLEERRRRLETEGLFASERKRSLPLLPRTIGVVTSPTGAVIRDILHRLEERCPCRVLVWPVLVQGEGAAEQITTAITGFNALPIEGPAPRPDLLIVARGGGSIEDLWPFNEEAVVRAAAASLIPLISAVGHETDTTLIDFAADRRAPTPSAAAEIAVPVRTELLARLAQLEERGGNGVERSLRERRSNLDGLRRGLPDPQSLLRMVGQRLDDLSERLVLRTPQAIVRSQCELLEARLRRLDELLADHLQRRAHRVDVLNERLAVDRLQTILLNGRQALKREQPRLRAAAQRTIDRAESRLANAWSLTESMSPARVLDRGYALVRAGGDGHVITRSTEAQRHATLKLVFADGELGVLNPGPNARRRRAGAEAPDAASQPSLI